MRVVVADDAVLFREGLSHVLTEAGFDVTARVGDAQALLGAVREDPTDCAVVDIGVPVLSAHVESHCALQLIDERVSDLGELTDAGRRVLAVLTFLRS